MTKKLDLNAIKTIVGSRYPAPYDEPCKKRERKRLGDAAGLTQFGVNLLRLPPGTWSSQRHWHVAEDEFVFVIEGEVVLVTDAGEEILRAGDCAGFKANDPDGHQIQNRSQRDAVLLEVGNRAPGKDGVTYPGIDLCIPIGADKFAHLDGAPY